MFSACPAGYTKFQYGASESCFKNEGYGFIDAAARKCTGGSSLPLPADLDEQADFVTIMESFDAYHKDRTTKAGEKVFSAALNLNIRQYEANRSRYRSRFSPTQPSGDGPYVHAWGAEGFWNDVYAAMEAWSICQLPVIKSTVDSCNKPNGEIQMIATLPNVEGDYGQDSNDRVTFDRSELTPSFETIDGDNYLVMSKVLGGDGCTQVVVDGVTICQEVGETVTLRCLYNLEDQTVSDDFDVTGQNTQATAENTGTLGYNLVVEQNKNIGDTIKFTLTPINAGLVYATVKTCDVTKAGSKALTIVGHGTDHCTNPVVNVKALTNNFSSDNAVEGTWTAFKWSTTAANNVEAQGLSCTIGLSENASTTPVADCTESNA